MKKYWLHFKTITIHKWYVMISCFKVGLFWQGVTHDLSKYTLREFIPSAKHFQGDSSPIDEEKRQRGYSLAWQSHKGRNKHHWQYWVDFKNGEAVALPMPPKYVAEMMCDWIGAGKAYNKKKWSMKTLKEWYAGNKKEQILHPTVQKYVELAIANSLMEKELYHVWLKKDFIKESLKMFE